MTREEKQKELRAIEAQIVATGGGPLAASGVNAVPGEGSATAEIMFIGEAPGFNENEQRRPFVGQAGKLLRRTLIENSWNEAEVYITNIVKFRPPENRDPLPNEIEFFRPLLDSQIEIIDPKVIVTLGRFSMYKFLGEGVSISRIHGQPRTMTWRGKKITIFPMFHPAAALRAGDVLKMFKEDFKKLRTLVDKGTLGSTDLLPDSTDTAPEVSQKKEEKPEAEQLNLI